MALATFTDVETRAGRYAPVFSQVGKHPDQADIEALLADLETEVNAAIESHGVDPAALDTGAKAALRDLIAYGALARALESVPGRELDELRSYARSVWAAAMGDPTASSREGLAGSIRLGTYPVIADIEAGQAGVSASSAGDFWSENPDFGSPAQVQSELRTLQPSLAPTFAKHQSL